MISHFCKILIICFLNSILIGAPIQVVSKAQNIKESLKTLIVNNQVYCSSNDFSRIIKCNLFHTIERGKTVLYIENKRVKITDQSDFLVVDNKSFQTSFPSVGINDDIFIPAQEFFSILKSTVLPGLEYHSNTNFLELDVEGFNINSVVIDEKANGTILYIKTKKEFPESNITAFNSKNGWFYITVKDGIIDNKKIEDTYTRGIVRRVTSDQFKESAQIAFKLRTAIEGYKLFQTNSPQEIVITLRTSVKTSRHIKTMKNQWFLDTVVLDAGHGGKDGGTQGRKGTKEKFITLDIAKRVGSLIERNSKVNVVYTREEDIFIPLKSRTQIANKKSGKLFISIHANSSPNKKVRGFETYLLRPGKTKDAISVASRENSVIKLEELKNNSYDNLEGTNLIMATMAQSMYMKESEDLAGLIQQEIGRKVNSKNRGVKQAGFYVLIGASMPNVLVEVGYLSNKHEEKLLREKTYRQKIAEGIYSAIMKFKKTKEEILARG